VILTVPVIVFSGFPVRPGDTIICTVCAHGQGATTGTALIGNTTTGQYTHALLRATVGTPLVGNVAEFILEDPSYGPLANSTPYPFLDYSASFFCSCLAGTIVGANLNSGNEYTLDDAPLVMAQNCEMLSTVEVEDGIVLMVYTGSSGPAK
jgi:hypothetical protein